MRHLDRGDQTFSCDQRAGLFQLPRSQSIADDGIAGDVERRNPIEEIFLSWFEQGQVRFVINHLHVSRRFFARLGALELNVILVRHQIRGHEDAAF